MVWFILSLLTALAVATHDAWLKKFFSHLRIYEMLTYPLLYSFPLFLVTLPFVPVPSLDRTFLFAFLISFPLNVLGFFLHIRAIQISPLSLTLPYLSFTPVFMLFTGFVVLGEMPNPSGILGIAIICAGGYIINVEAGRHSLMAPLRAIFRETGSWLMLLVAFIYSLGAVVGKQAIIHSSALFFSITFFTVFTILAPLALLAAGKIKLRTFKSEVGKGIIAGVLFFAHAVLHNVAISLTKAAYMISVKRLSLVFGLFYGGVIFKEKNIAMRIIGTLLMAAGAVLITLKGK
ncbi:MAG: DMT family transporter [Pseudomonadota bacterium]